MKVLKFSVQFISVLLFAWFMLSWMDVVADNCHPDPVHHAWNLFVLFFGKG